MTNEKVAEALRSPHGVELLTSTARRVKLDALANASRDEMQDFTISHLVMDNQITQAALQAYSRACGYCARDAEARKIELCEMCALLSVTLRHLTEQACEVTVAIVKWNGLHPDQTPLGNPEGNAVVADVIRDAGN